MIKNGLLLLAVEIAIIVGAIAYLSGCNFYVPKDIYLHGDVPGQEPQDPNDPKPVGDVTYTGNIAPLLNASCLKCHNADVSSGGFSFASYESTMNAVEVGKPGDSLLCYELEHQLMPPRGPFLSEENVKLICDWISDGAKK